MQKRFIVLITFFLAAFLLFNGCTQSDNKNNAAVNSNTNNSASNPTTFQGFVDAYTNVDFKVEYNSEAIYLDGNNSTSKRSVYSLGKNFETVVNGTATSPDGQTIGIFTEANVIACTKGTSIAPWDCIKYPRSAAPIVTNKLDYLVFEIRGIKSQYIVPAGTQNIAGENSTCFDLNYSTNVNTVCFTSDGIITKLSTKRAKAFQSNYSPIEITYTATSVSRTVTQADFNPPVEPKNAP